MNKQYYCIAEKIIFIFAFKLFIRQIKVLSTTQFWLIGIINFKKKKEEYSCIRWLKAEKSLHKIKLDFQMNANWTCFKRHYKCVAFILFNVFILV